MNVCYICNKFVDKEHECDEAKRIHANAEKENRQTVPWIAMNAIPTRTRVA